MRAKAFVAPGILSVNVPGAVADAYGFFYDDPTLYAFTFNGADYVATRSTKSSAGLAIAGITCSIIYEDSAANVGAGSLAFLDRNSIAAGDYAGTNIYVWDVVGDAIHSYSTSGDWVATCPAYKGGYLYWMELDSTPDGVTGEFGVRLVRADCDLTNDSVIQTYNFNHDGSASDCDIVGWGLAGTSALAWVVSTNERRMLRFPISGASATARDDSGDTYKPAVSGGIRTSVGVTDGLGNCIFAGGSVGVDGPLAFKHEDNDSTAISALWPTWTDIGLQSAENFCGSISTDSDTFQVTGAYNPFGNGDHVIRDAAGGTADASPNYIELYNQDPPDPPAAMGEIYFYFES